MKLSSDAAVLRLTHEGITSLASLTDFDDKAIKYLPKVCKGDIAEILLDADNGIDAEPPVNGANISSISVQQPYLPYLVSLFRLLPKRILLRHLHRLLMLPHSSLPFLLRLSDFVQS